MQKWQEKGQRCTKIPIFIDFLPVQPDVPYTGGGGVTSIIKVYTDVRLEWGILLRPPSI